MTLRIRPHKGGRTARAPQARIRPQTLQRIHETMQERKASFADLLEEEYSQGESTMYYYAAESSMGLTYTYDSPCWTLLAFDSKAKRDAYVKAHSDKAESVNYKTACKVAPELRTEAPGKAWRTVLM